MTFKASMLPNLTGKVAIITGANSGIGKSMTLELCRQGCHVFMACRNKAKAEEAKQDIEKSLQQDSQERKASTTSAPKPGALSLLLVDLASLKSTNACADEFLALKKPLHMLLNNAGYGADIMELSEDGIEKSFQSNHLSHLLLTLRLLPLLSQQSDARIVNTSSLMHKRPYKNGLELDQLQDAKHFSNMSSYGMTKLCNVYFTQELDRRLTAKQRNNVRVNCFHPGVVLTNFSVDKKFFSWYTLLRTFQPLFGRTPAQGALGGLYLSASEDICNKDIRGKYIVDGNRVQMVSGFAKDEQQQLQLWNYSLELIKEKLNVDLTV